MSIRPKDSDSIIRLLSFARISVALYRLVAVNALDATFGDRREYTRRSNELFRLLYEKMERTTDWVEKSRLISALFLLASETSSTYDPKRGGLCSQAVTRLLVAYKKVEEKNELVEICLCRCLTDFFYPLEENDESEEWFVFLKQTLRRWAETLSDDGSWRGLSDNQAPERIGVMNRSSSLFLDEAFDTQIRNAYGYYSTHIPIRKNRSETDSTEENNDLYTLTRLYDVARQGYVYPVDRVTAHKIATAIDKWHQQFPPGSDDWFFSLSYLIDNLCEGIADDRQEELLVGMSGKT